MPEQLETRGSIEALLETIGSKDEELGLVLTNFHERLKRLESHTEKPDQRTAGGVTVTI